MQDLIEKELKRLQKKYGVGWELKVYWRPTPPHERPIVYRADGKKMRINGEWTTNSIIIYEDQNEEKIIHCLHHEFVEWMLLSDLVDPYVILANALQNVFRTLTYKTQEKRIEILAKLEDEEYAKLKRNTRKH